MAKSQLDETVDELTDAAGWPRERSEKILSDFGRQLIDRAKGAAQSKLKRAAERLGTHGRSSGGGSRKRKTAAAGAAGQ